MAASTAKRRGCNPHDSLVLLLIACLLGALDCLGCSVPVFRYALERWPAATYEAIFFTQGAASSDVVQQSNAMSAAAQKLSANITTRVVDWGSATPEDSKLWKAQTNAAAPLLVVKRPDSEATDPPLWSGAPQKAECEALVDSPARRDLVSRLTNGDAVVWVLIESGHRDEDEKAATLLTNELRRLETVLKLPPPAADDPAPRSTLPLRIQFSVQRVSPQKEPLFANMLANGEALEESAPSVVPVFGRARALAVISGKELTPSVIRQGSAFLCGACSCEVKELNPGHDLLVSAKWESLLTSVPDDTAAPPPAITEGQRVEIAPGNPPAPPTPKAHSNQGNQRRGMHLLASVGLAVSAIMVLLVGVVLLRSLRHS